MLSLLSGLQVCRKNFAKTISNIRGLLKVEPASWAAPDFKEILDSFKKGVEDVAKSSSALEREDIEAVVYAYRSFCNAVAAGDPLKRNRCIMTVTYAESLVAASDKKETLGKLAAEMQNLEDLLKI